MPTAVFHRADAARLPLKDKSVDLVFASPFYCDCRSYGINALFACEDWISQMIPITKEALRVSRGLVVWVVDGPTRDGQYWPAPEGLAYRLWREGIHQWAPACWYKVDEKGGGCGLPGSGGKQALRRDWEKILIFKNPGPLPYANPKANGHPPLFPPGGKIRNRSQDGTRNPQAFSQPKIVNPGNVIRARVGGNHMGDEECHENEAPFPEKLAAWWINAYCPLLGRVCDPFSGSGTTIVEAIRLGRHGIGFDLRQDQVELGRRRLARRRAEGRCS